MKTSSKASEDSILEYTYKALSELLLDFLSDK